VADTQVHSRPSGWTQIDDDQCRRLSGALEFIGRRWSGSILLAMTRGATRFGEIRASVSGLSDRMLAARLKEFEHAGLATRLVEPTTPVSVRYELTPRGAALMNAVRPLAEFGEVWSD
jgi:DNA-binding HxlR family transcriptional regulator